MCYMLQKYTLTILLSATNTDEQNNEILQKADETIKKLNGKILTVDEPYRRRLAFVIKKVRNGIYANLTFEINNLEIQKLNRELMLINDVLRFQINKYIEIKKSTKKETKPKKTEYPKVKVNMDDLDKKINEILENNN